MNPLQLTYPRECVRCHRHTHEARLCRECQAFDAHVTKYQLTALKMIFGAFPKENQPKTRERK